MKSWKGANQQEKRTWTPEGKRERAERKELNFTLRTDAQEE